MDHHLILSLFHIFLVAPLFFVIAFLRSDLPLWAYQALIGLGLFVLVYHGYKLFLRLSQRSSYVWVNAIHVLFVAPLLLYIGYNKQETPRGAYEIAAMTGFAVLGYHLYSLVQQIHVIPTDK